MKFTFVALSYKTSVRANSPEPESKWILAKQQAVLEAATQFHIATNHKGCRKIKNVQDTPPWLCHISTLLWSSAQFGE